MLAFSNHTEFKEITVIQGNNFKSKSLEELAHNIMVSMD